MWKLGLAQRYFEGLDDPTTLELPIPLLPSVNAGLIMAGLALEQEEPLLEEPLVEEWGPNVI